MDLRSTSGERCLGRFGVLLLVLLTGGCGFMHTAKVEGVARNAATGEPVPDALLVCEWFGYASRLFDTVGHGFHTERAVTDKEGKYTIPAVTIVEAFGKHVQGMACSFWHPLYYGGGWTWLKDRDPGRDLTAYDNIAEQYERDGVIRYDAKLPYIEDRFKGGDKDLEYFQTFLSEQKRFDFAGLKKEFGVRYKFEEILPAWKRINDTLYPEAELKSIREARKYFEKLREGGY